MYLHGDQEGKWKLKSFENNKLNLQYPRHRSSLIHGQETGPDVTFDVNFLIYKAEIFPKYLFHMDLVRMK